MAPKHLIVQKYGGSSLESAERIRAIADQVARRARGDTQVIVIVSAMGRSTDELIQLAGAITPSPARRELDMLLTVGERISMALLSMALNSIGCRAISFTGSQCGIVTSSGHSNATIEEIRPTRIEAALADGQVVIVAGFQGVSRDREITTLGRGGSDTTAVALAATMGAHRCEIFSDFPGVFTADPRVVPTAHRIPSMSYDDLVELAALGARVLHFRAAEIARRFGVPLRLLASFGGTEGTDVSGTTHIESTRVTSVTSTPEVVLLQATAGSTGVLDDHLADLAGRGVRVMRLHRETSAGVHSVTAIIEWEEGRSLQELGPLTGHGIDIEVRTGVAAVSCVGAGSSGQAAVVGTLGHLLDESGIEVVCIDSSSTSVTCVVPKVAGDRATRLLHDALVTAT